MNEVRILAPGRQRVRHRLLLKLPAHRDIADQRLEGLGIAARSGFARRSSPLRIMRRPPEQMIEIGGDEGGARP